MELRTRLGGPLYPTVELIKNERGAGIGFSAFDTKLSLCSLLRRLKRRLPFVWLLGYFMFAAPNPCACAARA